MRNAKALAIKFIATFVLLFLILVGVEGMTFGEIFLLSMILSVVSYVLGDLILLPRTSNTISALADFGLAFTIVYFLTGGMTGGSTYLIRSIVAALALTVFELFFHRNILRAVLSGRRNNKREAVRMAPAKLRYQTEASKEIHPEFPTKPTDEFHLKNRDKE
ncbi:YndM family protein [Rossellomorea aquimaris]|uniref:YndM family protein n=1 Tax=Rossellomorea aquimaris TaxID=189382 RepID=UPI001CD775D2|nr:YndM family protein [Rossellomorea aquimaris]MCA1053725.1 YndM family protein [Rossellomorea aquimaris]